MVSLQNKDQQKVLIDFSQQKVHAIAGIGHPQIFFDRLKRHNIQVIEHVFPDHYLYQPKDIYFEDDLPVIMTEKDAVKCFSFANDKHWFLKVEAVLSNDLGNKILMRLREMR